MEEGFNTMTEAAAMTAGPQEEGFAVEDGELDVTETEAAAPAEDAAPAQDSLQQEPGELFPLKYNGQTVRVKRDEIITLAQKGMNYDKVYQRLMESQDSPEHRLVARLAAANGLQPQEYLARAEELAAGQFVREQAEKGVPEDMARQIWQDRQELAAYRQLAAREAGMMDASARQDQALRDEFATFVAEYPGVQALPPEVIAIKQANPEDSITSAYRKWELGQLRMQLDANRADRHNRATAPGSAAGMGRPDSDPFLDGWENV